MLILGAEVMQIYSHFIYLNTTEICLFFTVCQQPCPKPTFKFIPSITFALIFRPLQFPLFGK